MPLDPSKIRARREALKLSQMEAARLSGMAQPNWARVESGDLGDCDLSTAESVAKALRVQLGKLLTDSPRP